MQQMKFERLAKVLAPLMTGKPVEVTISGNKAYTTGDRINIPRGDFSDPDFVQMAHGYIDHELGHNAFTDFSVSQAAAHESKLLNKLRNALEDVRMEHLQGKAWPGAKINLNKLATSCVEKGYFPPIAQLESATQQILYFCLYWGRFHVNQQHALGYLADDAELHLRQQLGNELVDKILNELVTIKDAKSNQDCLDIARAILKLLEDEVDDSEEPDDSDEPEDSSSDSDQSEDSDDGDSSDNSRPGQQGNNADQDKERSDDASGSSATDFIKQALESGDDDDVKDIHKIIAAELEGLAEEAQREDFDTDLAGMSYQLGFINNPIPGASIDDAAARVVGRQVYKSIRRVLLDQTMNQRVIAQSGKRIAKRRLAGVKAGAQSVFERRHIKTEPTCAITFLVDASGSMKATNMKLVSECCFALTTGLEKSHVSTEVVYYGARKSPDSSDGLYIAKRFEDKHCKASRFCVGHAGSTPTSEAMMHGLLSLSQRTEDKRIMFVLTDGSPNDQAAVVTMRKHAASAGVSVVPIGIKTQVVKGFSADDFVPVLNLAELTEAVKHAVKLGLIK